MFIEDSDEEKEDTRVEKEATKDKEIEIKREEGGGDRESPKEKTQMHECLEKQLERKNPAPKDPRARLEAILARV